MIRKQFFSILFLTVMGQLCAVAPVNFVRPWDYNLQLRKRSEQRVQLSNTFLLGTTSGVQAWDGNGDKVNDTQLWNADQNALAMVKGYAAGTELANIAQECNAIDGDDGVRGHFKVGGDFKVHFSYMFQWRYYFSDNWWISAALPFYKTELKGLTFTDQTKSITADDTCTKTNITDNIATNVANWGNGLSLSSWERAGQGDALLMGGWTGSYRQRKPWIKRVDPAVRVGVTIPTGIKNDENKVMFMPFGNDGSVGLIVGSGLNINFVHRIDAGIDVELTHVFNNTRMRRIKVDKDQTDFLLLTKTEVQKDPGFTQRFTLYCEPKIGKGISARLAYQYVKRGEETLYVISNDYNSTIANTADSLKEWTTHNLIAQLKWDTSTEEHQKNRPQFNLFFMHPFKGIRSVQSQQFGFGMTMSF